MPKPPIEVAMGNFVQITAKSTVAVIVPLFGFWNDVPNNRVNGEVLSTTLQYLDSSIHHLLFIFVYDPTTLENNPKDPHSVTNILASKAAGGNVLNVHVERSAPYSEYIDAGLQAALEETRAQFFVVANPWTLIQAGALDVAIDRVNYGDNAKVVSGFNMRELIEWDQFATFKTTMPTEQYDLSFDFACFPRFLAEMIFLDPNIRTHLFLERDVWQQVQYKGFDVITTQRVPIFPFDFPWSDYETKDEFEMDRAYFNEKWHFDPGLKMPEKLLYPEDVEKAAEESHE